MKKLLSVLLLGASALCMTAQVDNEWTFNAPEKYQPATTQVIVIRTSPCNQGEEAFMDFIPKFRKEKVFRDRRIKLSADDEYGRMCAGNFDNWSIVKAGKGVNKRDGYGYFGTWYNVSADNVCFIYNDWPTDPDSPWGGSGAYFRFQRIDGKWFLTGIQLAG